jgi:hypothetical protein
MAHIILGEKSRFDKTPKGWLKIGSQINDLVNEWSCRSDIVTFVGDGAGHGSPACYIPAIAEMEVDVTLAFGEGTDPMFVGDLSKRAVQFDYPVAMGAVMHEAFHAKHSKFDLLEVSKIKDRFISGLITWFEETRIEARAVKALPKNRAFIRACALRLVIGDLKDDEDFSARGIQAFSQLMLLTLARVDSDSLDPEDVKIVHDAALTLFGEEVLAKLRSVWVRAQAHKIDTDYAPLQKLAEEWVKILEDSGQDTKDPDSIPDWLKELLEQMMGEGSEPGDGDGEEGEGSGSGEGEPSEGEGKGSGGSLLDKMADGTETDAQSEANAQAVTEVLEAKAEKMAEAAAEAKTHKDTAAKVFGRGTGPAGFTTSSRLCEERMPNAKERSAAVALSKLLEKARYRDRVVVKRTSVIPPGRLNARRALAAAEQKSRGAEVTSEAWSRKQRKHTEDPTLKIGVMCDISGSMGMAMEPMASTAWILSEATRRVQGQCAMVYYGNDVFPTLKPGQHLDKVHVYTAPDGTERFDKAFKALDGTVNLLNSTGARLLVIVSDLYYTGGEVERLMYWMRRCRDAGVAVVIIPFDYEDNARDVVKRSKVGGIEMVPHKLTKDIVGAAKAIGTAAVRQLEAVSQ